MRILLVLAHPLEESFAAAVAETARATLQAAGHDVDWLDLYRENFDPRLSAKERRGYFGEDYDISGVASITSRLKAAEGLILVFPQWWFNFPAILKGFFDRVFLPGVSFNLVGGKVRGSLHNVGKVVAITSYGGSHLKAFLIGDPPRRIIMRMLRAAVKPFAPFRYLAHYSMNLSTDRSRRAFLAKVEATLAKL